MKADTIEDALGVSAAKTMGLATDGASAVIGAKQGAAAYLKEKNPSMLSMHCVAYKGNLAVASSCASVPLATETDTLLTDAGCRVRAFTSSCPDSLCSGEKSDNHVFAVCVVRSKHRTW